MARRAPKKPTGSEIPAWVDKALEAEAKTRKTKAEKPPAETPEQEIERLKQQLAACDAERQQAIALLTAFGKDVSVLGGKMQACVTSR